MSEANFDMVSLVLKGQVTGLQVTQEGMIVSVVIGIPAEKLNLPRIILAGVDSQIALDPVVDVTLRIDKKRVVSIPLPLAPSPLHRYRKRLGVVADLPDEVLAAKWDGTPDQAVALRAAGCAVEFEGGGLSGPLLRVSTAQNTIPLYVRSGDLIVKASDTTLLVESELSFYRLYERA